LKGRIRILLSFVLIITGMAILAWWLTANPTREITASIPGADNRLSSAGSVEKSVKIGEFFEQYETEKIELNETWPGFRGEDFDNISKSPVKLIDKFGQSGPKITWTVELGEGYAGPAIYKGLVYLLDYNEEMRADMLHCYSLLSGKELWRRWYQVAVKRNHGMSRTIPAVTEEYVLTIGPRGHVMCVKRETGDFLWGIDIEKQYESEIPLWYTGQCPLIDNNKAIIATGGKALMIAVDCSSGKILWETPNNQGWKMSHSSVMPFSFGGRKMYVYSAVGGVCGIAADGEDEGRILWSTSAWNHPVVAPAPVCMPDGRIFITAGYGAGSMNLRLTGSGDNFKIEVLDEYTPKDGLSCEIQTPIYFRGHLFGILTKDAATVRNQLVCADPADTKKFVWTSGQENRFGMGPFIIADNKLYLLTDDGTLTIIRPDISRYIQLDQARIFEGQDAWGPFAIADGFLLMRDSKRMFCLDMRI
jgi:outer membrane protein assembly factor BamB